MVIRLRTARMTATRNKYFQVILSEEVLENNLNHAKWLR